MPPKGSKRRSASGHDKSMHGKPPPQKVAGSSSAVKPVGFSDEYPAVQPSGRKRRSILGNQPVPGKSLSSNLEESDQIAGSSSAVSKPKPRLVLKLNEAQRPSTDSAAISKQTRGDMASSQFSSATSLYAPPTSQILFNRRITRSSADLMSDVGALPSPGRLSVDRKIGRGVSRDASASSSLSPVEQTTPPVSRVAGKRAPIREVPSEESSDEEEHQPAPAPAVPHLMTFGEDPWEYPDPTVYEIRKVTPDMSEDEIKKIYSVADYPHDDLHDLIPGTPPDRDFSNAKPVNQVQATTFATHVDHYLRPFTEEDLAFLRDRGDRTTPFIVPRRGKKHYTEIWAEEDGLLSADHPHQSRDKLPANQPRGSIEDLDEAVAETDEISVGPVLERILTLMRPEHRAPPSDATAAVNGISDGNADLDSSLGLESMAVDSPAAPLLPATYMPESATEGWKKANHPKLDHAQVDERLKQELRFIGFMPENADPQYDDNLDDEVSARIRMLQGMLKERVLVNGAKKALIMDKVKERMAHQEYSTILEDLDSQVQTSFSKRTRSMGKKTKGKRPGGAGGGSHMAAQGMARPGIGDATKTLMERRKKWIENIGPVFEGQTGRVPRAADEGSSIFPLEIMADYIKREKENWDEEVEEE